MRSDLWSLGVTLFEALTGRPPFAARTFSELVNKLLADAPPDPRELVPDAPQWLCAAIASCLRRDPKDRPESAAALRAVLLRGGAEFGPLSQRALAPTMPPPPMPASVRATGPRTNLPEEDDGFVGRDAELAALGDLLERERFVTLLGPGGTGKTRLALRAARGLREADEGGVWFCDLSSARTAPELVETVARALRVPAIDPGVSPERRVARALAARGACALVLDNFEQLLEHANVVAGWLAAAPALRVVVTSRAALRVQGEHVVEVDPLGEDDGMLLFATCAAAAGAPIRGEDAAAVRDVVRRLEGIPLAIELAAARLRTLSLAQLAERLGDRLRLLTSVRRDAPPRQATLRGTIESSWELLSPRERSTFAQCAVFRGGFALEAAEAVVDAGDVPVIDVLESLRDRSILRATRDGFGNARFRMLETLREFAWEKIAAGEGAVDLAGLRARHAKAMIAWVERTTSFDPPLDVRARLRADADNVLEAVEFAAASGDASGALRALLALEPLYASYNPRALAERLDHALSLANDDDATTLRARIVREGLVAQSDPRAAHAALGALLPRARAAGPALEARCLYETADAARAFGETDEGRRLLLRVIALEGGPRASALAAQATARRSALSWLAGDLATAEAEAEAAIGAAAPHARAQGHMALATVCIQRRDHARTEANALAALELARAIEQRRMEAAILNNLGVLHQDQGDPASAARRFHQGLSLAREIGLTFIEGVLLVNLGLTAVFERRTDEARAWLQAGTRTLAAFGDRRYRAWAAAWLAALAADDDRLELARDLLRHGDGVAREIADASIVFAIAVLGGHAELAEARAAEARGETTVAAARRARATQLVRDARAERPEGAWALRSENVRFALRSLERALAEAGIPSV